MSERFWANVDKSGDCWEWQGYRNWAGYGVVAVAHSRKRVAHRVAYEELVGPIPDGMELDHLCRNRACVRPEHLEAVTHSVNVRRGMSPKAIAIREGVCARGHPRNETNGLIRRGVGTYNCRPCAAQRQAIRRAALRAKAYREDTDATD